MIGQCMYTIFDIEYDLMKYCLKKKGKWWANHFFRNKDVNDLYAQLRRRNLDEVLKIIEFKKL